MSVSGVSSLNIKRHLHKLVHFWVGQVLHNFQTRALCVRGRASTKYLDLLKLLLFLEWVQYILNSLSQWKERIWKWALYYIEWCEESTEDEVKHWQFSKVNCFNAVSSCAGSPSVSPDEEPIKIKPAELPSSPAWFPCAFAMTWPLDTAVKVKKYIGILLKLEINYWQRLWLRKWSRGIFL